ncbi:hypothetical protein [Brevibacillus marinus]|uniref:hypothetical protein n=1 Tax=Brevibacillus marinus TaxID=2496837 RepID=UPI000F84DF09|nr:hypothetical protein [Brevibacillus marinus]
MNKPMMFILFMSILLSACGSQPSWENEEIAAASDRIMADNVETRWTIEDGQTSEPGREALIRLEIRKDGGKPIEAFDINHEKLLHLIVISKDLSYFNHVHPEYKGNGVFEIANDFPAGGEYRLIADFKPTGGDSMTKMEWVKLGGEPAAPIPVVPDANWDKTVEGKRVRLSIDRLGVNEDTTLSFFFTDGKTGQPVTDLQPYLGAIGHVVILSEDGERYVHVHAEKGQGTGPNAVFETRFPKSGVYKIWGQFQVDNHVFTVPYVVNVP